jgi:hypothetical protein
VSRVYVPLAAGLRDVGGEDGLELPWSFLFQNWRVGPDGSISRRKGCQRFARFTQSNYAYDLNGTTQFVTRNLDTRVDTLKRYWTFEALVNPDNFATATKTILGVSHAADYGLKVFITTAGVLTAAVQDSAGTVVTLTSSALSAGTSYAIQVVRDGTSLYLRVNGATVDTDTMADLDGKLPGGNLLLGADNGPALFFDGKYDFARLLSLVLPDQRFGFMRWPYPVEEAVLFDYHDEEAAANMVDHSRFENHGTATGSPTAATANALCVPHMPVFGITSWLDRDAKTRVFAQSGNGYLLQELVK